MNHCTTRSQLAPADLPSGSACPWRNTFLRLSRKVHIPRWTVRCMSASQTCRTKCLLGLIVIGFPSLQKICTVCRLSGEHQSTIANLITSQPFELHHVFLAWCLHVSAGASAASVCVAACGSKILLFSGCKCASRSRFSRGVFMPLESA